MSEAGNRKLDKFGRESERTRRVRKSGAGQRLGAPPACPSSSTTQGHCLGLKSNILHPLAQVERCLLDDWNRRYAVRPIPLETFCDTPRWNLLKHSQPGSAKRRAAASST